MQLSDRIKKEAVPENSKLMLAIQHFELLLSEIAKKEIPEAVQSQIDTQLEELNKSTAEGAQLKRELERKKSAIIRVLARELKIVPKGYYRNLWMVLGMSGFGVPIGAALGTSLGDMVYLGIGLPIGMAVGVGIGASMDKKALQEGRQLDLELKNM